MNIHYARPIRDFFQYPNDLYWLEHENLTERQGYGHGGRWVRSYQWKKDKPLIIGEFAWSRHSNPPHGLSSFIGEDAYVGTNWRDAWRWAAKNKADAYRYSGAAANPWIYGEGKRVTVNLKDNDMFHLLFLLLFPFSTCVNREDYISIPCFKTSTARSLVMSMCVFRERIALLFSS